MRLLFVILLVLSFSCNKETGSGSSPKSTSGGSDSPDTSIAEASNYIKNSKAEIHPSLQIHSEDIDSWKNENLISEEEAVELKGSIQ